MAQRRGETGRQYMDRLRAVRGLPPMKDRDQLFHEMRAAKCILSADGFRGRPGLEMLAFMSIFHPEKAESPEILRTAREMDHEERMRRS